MVAGEGIVDPEPLVAEAGPEGQGVGRGAGAQCQDALVPVLDAAMEIAEPAPAAAPQRKSKKKPNQQQKAAAARKRMVPKASRPPAKRTGKVQIQKATLGNSRGKVLTLVALGIVVFGALGLILSSFGVL